MTQERAKEILAYAGLEGEKTKVYYMILSRIQSDCDYYLNYQRGMKGEIKDMYMRYPDIQTRVMEAIWTILPEKPEWLTIEQIRRYDYLMNADTQQGKCV